MSDQYPARRPGFCGWCGLGYEKGEMLLSDPNFADIHPGCKGRCYDKDADGRPVVWPRGAGIMPPNIYGDGI